jgi:hypothetical protein
VVASEKIERRDALAMLAMEQQSAEIKFQGEQLGSYTDKNTTYTLYSLAPDSVPDDVRRCVCGACR